MFLCETNYKNKHNLLEHYDNEELCNRKKEINEKLKKVNERLMEQNKKSEEIKKENTVNIINNISENVIDEIFENIINNIIDNKNLNNIIDNKNLNNIIDNNMINQNNIINNEIDNKTNNKMNNTNKKIKRKTIPHTLKRKVWAYWIGETIGKTKCLCCNLSDITQMTFHCGHIISVYNNEKIVLQILNQFVSHVIVQ